MPPSQIPDFLLKLDDKVIHASEFFILGLISCAAFSLEKPGVFSRHALMLSFVYALSLGAVTEWIQAWTPDRSPSWMDWAADAVGAVLAIALLFFVKKRLHKENPYGVR